MSHNTVEPFTPAEANSHGSRTWKLLADAFQKRRTPVARALLKGVSGIPRFAKDIANDGGLVLINGELSICADYLGLYFKTRDSHFLDLFISDRLTQCASDAGNSNDYALQARCNTAAADAEELTNLLRDGLNDAALELLNATLKIIGETFTHPVKFAMNQLLFADCISRDIRNCQIPACLREGIWIHHTLLFTKDVIAQRKALLGMADQSFDAIFYSPVTYGFSPAYYQTTTVKAAIWSKRKIQQHVDEVFKQVTASLDLLAGLFECSIFVHNSSDIRRHGGKAMEWATHLATYRTRALARERFNAKLADHVAHLNASTYNHFHIIDEMALVRQAGEWDLGRRLYDSDQDQPFIAMGRWASTHYHDALSVLAHLFKRKVVVCDLDNTLWDGVIGEGAVKHYQARQKSLRRLKEKGVLLAINSKNDPRNVRWDNAALTADDFVCTQINWNSKVSNMHDISRLLNLKTKDFVFIDDRADEREMMAVAFPGIHVMDATREREWRLLDLWASMLPDQEDADRTEAYKQRESREQFLESVKMPAQDEEILFAQLGLHATVRRAGSKDHNRVAELINRTNQFNLCGSRTTRREVAQWCADNHRHVLIVDVADKFGAMGTVCAAVLHETEQAVEIPIFVLSCRVFGYRIEDVIIDTAKRMSADRGVPVCGLYRETAHNEPCRRVYPDNGFVWTSEQWRYQGDSATELPEWLEVKFENVTGLHTGMQHANQGG